MQRRIYRDIAALCVCLFLACAVKAGAQINDWQPVVLEDLTYPRLALLVRIDGVVIARCGLEGDGTVREVSFLLGHGLLQGAVRDSLMRWQFAWRPGLSRKPASSVLMVFRFVIEGDGAGARMEGGGQEVVFEYPDLVTVRAQPLPLNPGEMAEP